MAHQKEVQVNTDRYIYKLPGIFRMPERWLGKYLRPEMHYEAVLCPHILPADALSQDLFESCD